MIHGWSIETPDIRTFGAALKSLGLIKGRKQANGRDARPYLMEVNAANYFIGWRKDHPTPPLGTITPESLRNAQANKLNRTESNPDAKSVTPTTGDIVLHCEKEK